MMDQGQTLSCRLSKHSHGARRPVRPDWCMTIQYMIMGREAIMLQHFIWPSHEKYATTRYIGIDLHTNNFTACILQENEA